MTDSRLKGRVKGLFAAASADELIEQPATPSTPFDSDTERQALQVLVLARRTADEHIASAQQEADTIQTKARAKAEQISREAQTKAAGVRREANKVLSDARAKAEQMSREAQANADRARRDADKTLAEARAQAEQIVEDAQANIDELEHEAQVRYQDVIGGMEVKSAALQQQIEALKQFERDYRDRLVTFMQSQLRSLGVGEQPLNGESEQPAPTATVPHPVQE
jgi:vacuolar-type H+-ATPase subunit E/Vma4